MSDTSSMRPIHETVPRPDPTSLTTEQLRRELGGLRELLESKIEAVRVRIDGIDAASVLLRSNLEQIVHPDDVTCLRDLTFSRIEKSEAVVLEKFARIDTQLIELDKRNSQLKTASDTAVSTAMTAAEKAVTTAMTAAEKAVAENTKSSTLAFDKSEKTTADALKSLDNQLKTEIRATNDKVAGIASRQDKSDGSNAMLFAVGSGAVAAMSLLIAGYVALRPAVEPRAPLPVMQYVQPPAVPAPVTVPR